MTGGNLTSLEHGIMQAYRARYAERGFPRPEELIVTKRDNDGGGRYTHFAHEGAVALRDGRLGLGIYSQFDMDGLEYGASFHLWIEGKKVRFLDVTPNGNRGWDGTEGSWVLLDPGPLDTGLFI